MNVVQQRRILSGLAIGFLALSGLVIAWATSDLPSAAAPVSQLARSLSTNQTSQDAEQADPLELASRPLRAPLYDSPPPPPRPPAPVVEKRPPPRRQPTPQPKLQLTLVGTIIDADERLAIVSDPAGQFDIKGIGEALELEPPGVRIRQIDAEQVTLEYQGNKSVVELDRTARPPDLTRRDNSVRRRP